MPGKSIVSTLLFLLTFQLAFGQEEAIKKRYQGLDELLGETSFFESHLTGFMLYDLDSQWVMFEKNSHINFIPASTTKLLTFYASLVTLSDSINTFRYVANGDEITIWGSGDPSWMYDLLPQPKIKEFLAPFKKIKFSDHNWNSTAFGYGWQWDDYYYSYSSERSPFPIYGNMVTISHSNNIPRVSPTLFKNSLSVTDKEMKGIERDFRSNAFYYNPKLYIPKKSAVPFITSPEIFVELASAILQKPIQLVKDVLPPEHKVFRGGNILPLWTEMLQESDNFIAEQLLLMVSDQVLGRMDTERIIDYTLKTYLWDLPDRPQWVDGSGLSRHNLATPRSMVNLIVKIEDILPRNQLIQLLSQGGINGTLKNNYKAPRPYVFAKTGTISNNHSMVGIIRTNRNKYYAFAFMNNNYLNKASEIRREMEKVLVYVRDSF